MNKWFKQASETKLELMFLQNRVKVLSRRIEELEKKLELLLNGQEVKEKASS